jgi:uncharacterized membrane protein
MSSTTVEAQEKQSRPFGVYVVLLLMMLLLIVSITDLWATNYFRLPPIAIPSVDHEIILFIIRGAITLAIIITMIGLWRLKRWAWYATMILFGIFLMWNILLYFDDDAVYLNLLAGIISVFYLNLHEVQAAFGTE